MVRETGAALAVLALYILVLLAPLHQAAAMQRDLGDLGYASLDTWSVCAPLAQEREDGETVAKCAATGIGKNEIVPVDLPSLHVETPGPAVTIEYHWLPILPSPSIEQHPSNPRAPPAFV